MIKCCSRRSLCTFFQFFSFQLSEDMEFERKFSSWRKAANLLFLQKISIAQLISIYPKMLFQFQCPTLNPTPFLLPQRNTNADQMFSSQPFSDKLMVLCRSLDNQNKQKDGCNNHNVFSFLTKIDALESLSLGTKLGLFCSLMVFQWFCIDQEMISYATLRSFGNQCPKEII